jgi:hypothetical protein
VNNELKIYGTKRSWPNLRNYPGICLDEPVKTVGGLAKFKRHYNFKLKSTLEINLPIPFISGRSSKPNVMIILPLLGYQSLVRENRVKSENGQERYRRRIMSERKKETKENNE